MHLLAQVSFLSMFGMLLCLVPLVAGVWYAFSPSERLLALMRPLTLGAIFAAITTFVIALANGCVDISMMSATEAQPLQVAAGFLTVRLMPVVVCFGCLAAAWFFVAIGTRRS